MMRILGYIGTAVLVLIGILSVGVNVVKIHNGCPPGQVLIKSVATYECIRR
ncbi:hypothetical protein OIU34_02440 [Pararhizobium sp. BT-229]|uniref:hypothetical protein n=1 Tax=Pararhizobium sp. BT-229 TaxID=2986923 RepID=UPI0021F72ADC|nr:hypothetical protein [Pararhizobium sp. BT-229]MCV9960746.1 hypothetical protein [Pararhizobium sp. BT-229]